MIVGGGENGKSTYLKLLRFFLGEKNISARTMQELETNRFASANLYRKLANIFPDLPTTGLINSTMFKTLTGGDYITVEKKFGREPIEFENYAKLIFSVNETPIVRDNTYAFWRRFILIDFPNEFSGDKKDVRLIDKITTKEELSGFFNKAIKALKRVLSNGKFTYELSVSDVKSYYRLLASPIAGFIDECLEQDNEAFETVEGLYNAFLKYCRDKKRTIVSEEVFAKKLKIYCDWEVTTFTTSVNKQRKRAIRGVKFKDEKDDVVDVIEKDINDYVGD